MTTLREAAQQALEALEAALSDDQPYIERCKQTITALRAALAEPVQEPDYWQEEARRYAGNADYWRKRYEALAEPVQEPVAWLDEEINCAYTPEELDGGTADGLVPLYTSPPQDGDKDGS